MSIITSTQNPLVKRVIKLKDRHKRLEEGTFTIEGRKEISLAIANSIQIDTIIHCRDLYPDYSHQDCNTLYIEVSQTVYAKIAYRQKAEGLIAIARTPKRNINTFKLPEKPFILVAQGIEKPGNLGALLRSADGAGVDAIILIENGGVDIFNPNVVRASLGSVFTVPTFNMDMSEARKWLTKNDIATILTTPSATIDYTQVDYNRPVAVVLGSESEGLPNKWLSDPNATKVIIPLLGHMDYLIVSCSAAIVLYQARQQRQ